MSSGTSLDTPAHTRSPTPADRMSSGTSSDAPAHTRSPTPAAAAVRLALAVSLSLAPCPASAVPLLAALAPSERDLAYERAVQAEEAGDHAAAADGYERAYALTAPAESGPRLLFLRASVSARLRAHEGSRDARSQLCPARALLRDHLGATADLAPGPSDPSLAERESLARVEQQLASAGIDCDRKPDPPPVDLPPPPDPKPAEPREPVIERPAPPTVAPTGPASNAGDRPRVTRALRISGGASLGVGAAAFAVMATGVALADRASDDGYETCREGQMACHSGVSPITDIRERGKRADQLVVAGAVLGGLGVLAGVVLLAVSKRAGRSRVAATPTLSPSSAGLTLRARF